MRRLILPEDMRACEARYFEATGVKSIDAMERASEALADVVRETVPAGGQVIFVCGSGGNGGDGIACARILKDEYETQIVIPKPLRSADALENLRRAENAGVPIVNAVSEEPSAWVDALLGTGLSREPDGAYAAWIDRMNESAAPVIAADIPSGLNGETGRAYGHCVRAARTVAFGFGKPGLFLQDGLEVSGEVSIAPVGFPDAAFESPIRLMDAGDVARQLPARRRNVYKNLCGHLLIVAGSFGMAGAAVMCARGAMRTGVGLVTIACPESIVPILQTLVPGAMCVPLPEKDGAIAGTDALRAAFAGKTAAVVGCGLSTRAYPDAVRAVLESGLPAVIDADALNLIAANGMQGLLRKYHVITPHPGEARRLLRGTDGLDELLQNPIAAAGRLSELGACALFKGASCVISDGRETFVSASGCSGMARGSSGDILSGIMGALIAEKSERTTALNAALASEIHGLAGERAQWKYGSRGMVAGDIVEFLPEVLRG